MSNVLSTARPFLLRPLSVVFRETAIGIDRIGELLYYDSTKPIRRLVYLQWLSGGGLTQSTEQRVPWRKERYAI